MKRTISIDARMIHSTGIGTYLRNLLENIATIDNEFQFQILCSEGEPLPELPAGQFEFRKAQAKIHGAIFAFSLPGGNRWDTNRKGSECSEPLR